MLSRLKDPVPILNSSNVVYRVKCEDCSAFYVGMTTRRLRQRLKEHACQPSSALYRHMSETDHRVLFDKPDILATDSCKTKLLIKESLKIKGLDRKSYMSIYLVP